MMMVKLISSMLPEGNNTMQICLLTDDYLSPSATYSRVLVNRNREAPLCLKAVAGISSSHLPVPAGRQTPLLMRWQIARLARGKNRKPMHRPKRRNYFNAQSTYVLPMDEKGRAFYLWPTFGTKPIFLVQLILWLPLQVDGDTVTIRWIDQ